MLPKPESQVGYVVVKQDESDEGTRYEKVSRLNLQPVARVELLSASAVNAVASHLLEQQLLSRPADIAKIFLDGTADWQEREVV